MRKRYWHFTEHKNKTATYNGKSIKFDVGDTISVDGYIAICKNGLHGSRQILNALLYAPYGTKYCHLVEIWGDLQERDDKVCGRYRRVISTVDCERVLHKFACWCAEEALKLVDESDPLSIAAIKAKRDWLDGKISDKDLAAARTAAWAATWDAARTVWDARTAAGAKQNRKLERMIRDRLEEVAVDE